MRELLEELYKQGTIVIQGRYTGPALLKGGKGELTPKRYDEKYGVPVNELIPPITRGNVLTCPIIQCKAINRTSCVLGIRVMYGITEGVIDHLVFQQDFTKNLPNGDSLNPGDYIEVRGEVHKYTRDDGSEDYNVFPKTYRKLYSENIN